MSEFPLAMGIEDVIRFDYMEAPEKRALLQALRLNFLLGAIDEDGKLTERGRLMSEFPLEPQFARCVLEAEKLECSNEMLTLVALLSAEGVWYRPSRQNADQMKKADA